MQIPTQQPKLPSKADVEKLHQQTKEAYGRFNTLKFINDNKALSHKRDLMLWFFEQLGKMGVDLKDPKAVGGFFANLKNQHPHIHDATGEILNELMNNEPYHTPKERK